MLVTLVCEGTASVHASTKASSLSRRAITRRSSLLKRPNRVQCSAMSTDHLTLLPGHVKNTLYVTSREADNVPAADRPLVHINKKGRPVSQCPHCRGLRKARAQHVKCDCAEKAHFKEECPHENGDGKGGHAGRIGIWNRAYTE